MHSMPEPYRPRTFCQGPRAVALIALVLAACGSAAAAGDDRSTPTTAAASTTTATATARLVLPPVAVIGASVSDGFDCVDPRVPAAPPKPGVIDPTAAFGNLGGGAARMRLAELLGAMVDRPTPPAFTSSIYFMNPSGIAEQQLKAALDARPALIFAIDYLFWHSYGAMPDGKREALLERGLQRLDKLLGPEPTSPMSNDGPTTAAPVIVIADLPDMSHAVGKMLMPTQMPELATLKKLNDKVAAWAAARPRVVQISLSTTVEQAMKSGTLELGGTTYTGQAARDLLTWDGLHATPTGVIALLNEAIARLQDRGVLTRNTAWDRDVDTVLTRLAARRKAAAAESAPAPAPTPDAAPAGAKP